MDYNKGNRFIAYVYLKSEKKRQYSATPLYIYIMKKICLFLLALLAALSSYMSYRTYTFRSLQPIGIAPIEPIAISDSVITHLSEAIQIRTISYDNSPTDSKAMNDLHQLLERHFPLCHRYLKPEKVATHSLLYEWTGKQSDLPPIMLIAHLDVVPAEDSTAWQNPPFSGLVKDGIVWGRGALDDKLSVWGALEAAEILLKQGFQPERTIYFGFGHDEEIGGQGAKAIAALLKKRGITLGMILDEGMVITQGIAPALSKPLASIGLAEKGYVSIQLTATSAGGHSSMPTPQTAVGILCRAVADLEANQMPQTLTPLTRQMFAAIGPETDMPLRAVFANQWLLEPVIKNALAKGNATNATTRTTTAPTMLQGSPKENVLAHQAKATINFRILPGETIDDVVNHIRKTIANDSIKIDTLPNGNNPGKIANVQSAYYAHLVQTAKEVFPDAIIAPGLVVATTDARHYEQITDNAFRFLPITLSKDDLSSIHGNNERIAVDNYKNLIRFYKRLMENEIKPVSIP